MLFIRRKEKTAKLSQLVEHNEVQMGNITLLTFSNFSVTFKTGQGHNTSTDT